MTTKLALQSALALVAVAFSVFFWRRGRRPSAARPTPALLGIGFLTDFLDTLGIGSFATTTTLFRFEKSVDDCAIPGTMNVGHTLPTIVQALLYIAIVDVAPVTLVGLIAASILGAWLGAERVARWPRRTVRTFMGAALLLAATLMAASAADLLPKGGDALSLSGGRLAVGIGVNFVLGALMTTGIGLYGPCMVLVAALGMNPVAAFPIMMGSCAFLMPAASVRFVREQAFDPRAAIGLAAGGIPGVLVATYVVRSLPLGALRVLVALVVTYTGVVLLHAAKTARD